MSHRKTSQCYLSLKFGFFLGTTVGGTLQFALCSCSRSAGDLTSIFLLTQDCFSALLTYYASLFCRLFHKFVFNGNCDFVGSRFPIKRSNLVVFDNPNIWSNDLHFRLLKEGFIGNNQPFSENRVVHHIFISLFCSRVVRDISFSCTKRDNLLIFVALWLIF